ncbi:MAG: thiol reductant ABC exporter subunit CydD [Solirubrobacteraceae bacterium]|jgi:thiol reductant ABC exporter CydD subunit
MPAPIDRRLLRESRAARTHLAAAAALGAIEAVLVVAQAVLLATVIARAALHGAGIAQLHGELIALGAVLGARALVNAGFELSGRFGAVRVMSEMRRRLVSHLLLDAPGLRPADVRTGDLAASAVQGIDALEGYFAGYLPQLMLASVVPLAVLGVAATVDPITAAMLALTVPILIGFMILIGKGTEAQTRKRIGALALLSAHFLDVVRGLETLRAYRRERVQERVLADVGDQYRHETMATLRLAFISSLVLELCAMIGTALIAATIGVQLCGGHLTLQAGLTVLLLAPELYGPLRQVGQQFHASADGVAASERIFATIDQPTPVQVAPATRPVPDPRTHEIRLGRVDYEYPGRPGLALHGVELELEPGAITALVGESGSGKSTIARLLMRFADPARGTVSCGATDLRALDLDGWRAQIAWVPQHPTLFTGTVEENVRLGAPNAGARQIDEALGAAGADRIVAGLPDGLATVIGEGGRRLSAGQRQRIALARAFVRDAPLLILDEPTAHLDEDNAIAIADAIERLARGRTTLLIVHHESLAARAQRIVRIDAGRIVAGAPAHQHAASLAGAGRPLRRPWDGPGARTADAA